MGLTAEIELSLVDAGLVKFFDSNREACKEIAERAFVYAKDNIADTGLPLRRDDVATSLQVALVTNESLREFLAVKKLRQKHWYNRFADLIVDRLWEELSPIEPPAED
jgi:hypothetical protein